MSITAPRGFKAAGIAAGLKSSGALDLALVTHDGDPQLSAAAAVFTTNRFPAAPVIHSRKVMASADPKRPPRAIVLNSGGANACTGPQGLVDTVTSAEQAAAGLGLASNQVLICSTGLIGQRLPITPLLTGIDQATAALAATPDAASAAAQAIMTTDTRPKEVVVTSPNESYSIGGMAKGAGMLAPELATMLVVLTADAVLPPAAAQSALTSACRASFERIDSDGCQSTNDTVILLSSGSSGTAPNPSEFTDLLTQACHDLARQLLADAEGADHDIAITVTGATSQAAALAVGRAIARSNLFKAAIYGRDANWGRILAAAGTVPVAVAPFDPNHVDLIINGVSLIRDGWSDRDRSQVDLTGRQVDITLDLHAGSRQATIWTNDLTHAYIEENSAYSS